ncbi:hypothetical protein PENOC_098820 [Penicillium occitanis (nom. inval.)]|nr:hypothetical protein PENOC_098820 [Penicillium occitanis (nom. inval.)]
MWVHALRKSAYVGIVVDGMPARGVGMSEEFKAELIASNEHWAEGFEVEIAHVGWLVKPRGYSGSLVVEFTNPVVAKNAIYGGTTWRPCSLSNRSYCKNGRVKMCKKCQKYRHVQAQCPEREYHYGLCAEVHAAWECPSKETRDLTVKCANCKGPHKASSDNCVIRQQETARARHAVMENSKRGTHRVPNYLQEKMKQSNIEPTPREAAKLTATKRQRQVQKKAAKKTAARGKKAQQASQNAPESTSAPAQEPAPESEPAPVPAPGPDQEPVHDSTLEPIREQEPELEAIIPTIKQPNAREAPTVPRTVSRTLTSGPVKAIPFKASGVAEKRPRGRPPKSKSSNNDDGEANPQDHVDAAFAASQSMPATIDPALLLNTDPPLSTAPRTTRKLAHKAWITA